MTLSQALMGKEIPPELREMLTIVPLRHLSFGNMAYEGEIVVHKAIAREVKDIFEKLFSLKFPIEQITPIVKFNWDDDASMAANNTSAFNYRLIKGTDRLSNHSYGLAIDINPLQNPYVKENVIAPTGAVYDITKPGTITKQIAGVIKSYGWQWGGDWRDLKDYQHFEKKLS